MSNVALGMARVSPLEADPWDELTCSLSPEAGTFLATYLHHHDALEHNASVVFEDHPEVQELISKRLLIWVGPETMGGFALTVVGRIIAERWQRFDAVRKALAS
jgi:hypothetical protein